MSIILARLYPSRDDLLTQLFGMISFELFGQLVGSVDPSSAFFAHAVAQMADFVGIP